MREQPKHAAARGVHAHEHALVDVRGTEALMAGVVDRADVRHEAQRGAHRLLRRLLVDRVGLFRIQRIGVGVPQAPVVVERGGVEGVGLVRHHVAHTEFVARRRVGAGAGHHADVRQEVSFEVKRRHLDAIAPAAHRLEQPSRDALGGLSLVVAGKHAVDIGVVHGPEALADVHGDVVRAGNDHDLLAGGDAAFGLDAPQAVHELRADV